MEKTMPHPVRWGILGTAKIARNWLAPAIHSSQRGRIAAVASRTYDKAEAFAAPYGDVKIYGEYSGLIDDPEIDAIYIPLPNSAHVEWTEKALRAGKHVLCEKPIALNAREIDHLIDVRNQTGKFVAEAFMVTHHPQWRRVRELLEQGAIGNLMHVQGSFSFFNDDARDIRNDASQGGGALRDIGVYPSVTTRFCTLQEPVACSAQLIWEHGIDATTRVWAEFPSFTMDFYVSMRMHAHQSMLFHGDQGWIRVHCPFNAKLYGDDVIELRDRSGVVRTERFPAVDQYVVEIDAFNATVLDGAPFECSLEFSRGNQRMIDMIYAAAAD